MKKNKIKIAVLNLVVVVFQISTIADGQVQYDHILAAFPPNETNQELIITHRPHYLFHTIHIQCNSLDALNHLNTYNFVTEFYTEFELYFDGCFLNTSANNTYDNYKFNLVNLIKNFQIFLNWNQLIIKFNTQSNIDENIFFYQMNLANFKDKIKLINTNFVEQKFLKYLYVNLNQLYLENLQHINLNNFVTNNITELIFQNNTLLNLTRKNLKKFENLKKLTIKNFGITTNFSTKRKLFKLNKSLVDLKFINFISDRIFNKIVLNNKLFYGLTSLEYLELRNLKLERVPTKLFYELANIVDVSVADNNIHTLDANLFRFNEYLKRVDLSGNNILFISGCDPSVGPIAIEFFPVENSANENVTSAEEDTVPDVCKLEFFSNKISIYLDEDRIKNENLLEHLQKINNIENIYLGHENLYE